MSNEYLVIGIANSKVNFINAVLSSKDKELLADARDVISERMGVKNVDYFMMVQNDRVLLETRVRLDGDEYVFDGRNHPVNEYLQVVRERGEMG